MATPEQCRAALEELASRLAGVDGERKQSIPDRTLSLHLLDLDLMYRGMLHDGALTDIMQSDPEGPKADIRLSMSSDDLIALTEHRLHFAHAWATGKVRLDASLRDLLRLRSIARS